MTFPCEDVIIDRLTVAEAVDIDEPSQAQAPSPKRSRRIIDDVDAPVTQDRRQQPMNEPMPDQFRTFMAMMKQQQDAHASQMRDLIQIVRRSPTETAPQPTVQHVPLGNDVATLLRMSEALRGQDNPSWRLAPGLVLPRFLPERFIIVSIPHLLFREDPVTGEMKKVPNGTAFNNYKSILPTCKFTFANQVAITMPKGTGDKHSQEATSGVRAQVERAERVFSELLLRLDNADASSLPTTKSDWLVFIDAGATLLDHYATLAMGFQRGGGKVAMQHNLSITTRGVFDPVKLWPSEASSSQDSFRSSH